MVKILRIEKTKDFVRYRIRSPRMFKKKPYGTLDVGRRFHTKLIRARLKKSNKWATQSVLITRADYQKGIRVKVVKGKPVIYQKK